MPNYVRLLIEMMSKKQKLEEFKTISLTRECSTILHRKLPKKEKDPMSFTIPCKIADTTFKKVLCYLGASKNLMPLSIFKSDSRKQSLQPLHFKWPTNPLGVIEDMFIKVDKFIDPVHFVVLDMENDNEVRLILGRPLLAM